MKKRIMVAWAMGVMLLANATTYYWVGGAYGANEKGDATDLNNWSTTYTQEVGGGTHPASLPTSADDLCAYRDFYFDLNGGTLSVGAMNARAGTNPYGAGIWGVVGHSWQFTNGTFSCSSLYARLRTSDAMTLWSGTKFICTGYFAPGTGMGSDGIMKVNVEDGAELDISAGSYRSYNGQLNIKNGARATLGAVGVEGGSAQKTNWIKNWGTCCFPSGVSLVDGSSANGKITIYQESGRMTLGGPVSRNGKAVALAFCWDGGVIEATRDVSFVDASPTLAASAVVTADVSNASALLDLSSFTVGSGVTLVKRGPGSLCLGALTPATVRVEEGLLRLAVNGMTYDPATVLAANGGLLFAAENVTVSALTADPASVYAVDPAVLAPGMVFLLSDSETVLETVLAGVNNWCAANEVALRAQRAGNSLVLVAHAQHTFDATSGKALTDPAGWGASAVPLGEEVDVAGVGIVDYTASAPAFAALRLRDGATLRVVGGTEDNPVQLPPLELLGTVRLLVGEGSYAALTNQLRTVKVNGVLPIFEIATNGAIFVQGEETVTREKVLSEPIADVYRNKIRFKDVDMRIYGDLVTPIACVQYSGVPFPSRYVDLYLGTADVGETSEFKLTVDGGRICLRDYSWNYGFARLWIASPSTGGVVHCPEPLLFRNATQPVYKYNESNRALSGLSIGVGNPTNETVVIQAENTELLVSDTSAIAGNIDFRLSNGATLRRSTFVQTHFIDLTIKERAKLTFTDTLFRYGRVTPGRGLTFTPDEDGFDCLSLTRVHFTPWTVLGNGRGVATFADTTWCVGNFLPTENNSSHPELVTYTVPPTPVFNGFKEVRLPEGTTFTLIGTNETFLSTLSPEKFRLHWDRTIDFARGVPITGGGDIRVSNVAPTNTMTATFLCGSNTCTGTVTAEPDTRTTVRFADGANWAGTVVANGCVELFATNALGVACPATVNFGALRLEEDFALRVWKDAAGATNDVVNLDSACAGTGRIVGAPQAGYEPQGGDIFSVGLYPAEAILPQGRGAWTVMSAPSEVPGFVTLKLRYRSRGVTIYFH